jgi:hypothetical protein
MKYILPIWLFISCCWYVSMRPANESLVLFAQTYVGHQEIGSNRSPLIDHWNRRLGIPLGSSWCATFLAAGLDSAQAVQPSVRSAVAQHYITRESIPAGRIAGGQEVPPGTIVVWKRGESWSGHVEITEHAWKGPRGQTIGGNTSPGYEGSQWDGSGVWRKNRHIDPTAYFRITHFTLVY